jgi:hypothetical protein
MPARVLKGQKVYFILSRDVHIVFPMALQPTLSLVLLCIEVFYPHTIRHTIGLLWTSDQPVAETSTYTGQHNI